jgi:hypothetical protein
MLRSVIYLPIGKPTWQPHKTVLILWLQLANCVRSYTEFCCNKEDHYRGDKRPSIGRSRTHLNMTNSVPSKFKRQIYRDTCCLLSLLLLLLLLLLPPQKFTTVFSSTLSLTSFSACPVITLVNYTAYISIATSRCLMLPTVSWIWYTSAMNLFEKIIPWKKSYDASVFIRWIIIIIIIIINIIHHHHPPLYARRSSGSTGGIAPTLSQPRH